LYHLPFMPLYRSLCGRGLTGIKRFDCIYYFLASKVSRAVTAICCVFGFGYPA
jgi:hypothetical protein